MKCPFCHHENDRVVDSRTSPEGYVIRRRRECLDCKRRFTTHERMEEPSILVVKKDGTRVPFDRNKIKSGLEKACWKRPISAEQIDAMVTQVELEVHSRFDTEVESRELGELVMSELRKLDQVAYVRFASVYRQFEDARDFVEAVRPILHDLPHKERT